MRGDREALPDCSPLSAPVRPFVRAFPPGWHPPAPPGPETALSRPVSRVCGRNRGNAAPPGRGEDGGRKRCRKKQKADALVSGDSFFTFISSLRQPIECFFNWYNRLTSIQTAPMVRSLPGLLSHVFGRVAAALISLICNP